LVGKEYGRGPQKQNKEITKSDPISLDAMAQESPGKKVREGNQ
jgi:hypothetical protein